MSVLQPTEQPPTRGTAAEGSAGNRGDGRVAAVLFLCLFAGQSGAIALSPVLVDLAHDLRVSVVAAGQLRTVAGLAAGITALALARVGGWVSLTRQLLGGSLLLAVGSLASAVAPSIRMLAAAQIPVGAGIAILTTAATLAAGEWVPPERRAATLSWVLIGQPAAWIIGMPLLGAAGQQSWRYAWLVLPFAAAVLAAAAIASAGRRDTSKASAAPGSVRAALRAPGVSRWLAAEMFANTAWAGMLVYAGVLFVESYGISGAVTGCVLAVGAAAYVSGNLAFRRLSDRDPRRLLIRLSAALALAAALFGSVRPSLLMSMAFFCAAAFAAGGRTLISSAFGLTAPSELRRSAMAMRAASMQFGYFTGSFAAGAALHAGGYPAFGATIGALFLSAALALAHPQLQARTVLRRVRPAGADVVANDIPTSWS